MIQTNNGWEHAAEVKAINNEYSGIETPLDLYDALCDAWCIETCAPRLRELWSEQNKTCGQCSITAFLAQDIFGGEVYDCSLKQDRKSEQHFANPEKRERYELLKDRLKSRR